MSKPLTTEEKVRKCFQLESTWNWPAIARAARRFTRMEERQKAEKDWEAFRKSCRKTETNGKAR